MFLRYIDFFSIREYGGSSALFRVLVLLNFVFFLQKIYHNLKAVVANFNKKKHETILLPNQNKYFARYKKKDKQNNGYAYLSEVFFSSLRLFIY